MAGRQTATGPGQFLNIRETDPRHSRERTPRRTVSGPRGEGPHCACRGSCADINQPEGDRRLCPGRISRETTLPKRSEPQELRPSNSFGSRVRVTFPISPRTPPRLRPTSEISRATTHLAHSHTLDARPIPLRRSAAWSYLIYQSNSDKSPECRQVRQTRNESERRYS